MVLLTGTDCSCFREISDLWIMKITFYGAAQNVTGSKHLIDTQGYKILLDCGLHQGRRAEVAPLNKEFAFAAQDVNAVILSHGHADHCGMLPVLVKQGFRGNIYATPATCEVASYILQDSAKIQEQDANYFNDHLPLGEDPIAPLYTTEDAEAVAQHFAPTPYFWHSKEWTRLSDRVRFKLYDAGHILGSSIILLEITEDGVTKTVAFTGDLGHTNTPILRDPEIISEPVDVLLSECTYGNRTHSSLEDAKDKLEHVVKIAVEHKSKIVVPAFSLGRTQELTYILHQLTDARRIPRLPIYIDSPLATKMTGVFGRHTEEYDAESWRDFSEVGEEPLEFRNLLYTESIEDSKRLNSLPGPVMIISASGMCEGGRVLHHLKNNIEDPNAIIMFTGYQGVGTLGRKIIEGVSPVRIFGQYFSVNAHIVKFNEFSAHADQNQLLSYITSLHALKQIYLVHTEEDQATTFAPLLKEKLPTAHITVPKYNDSFEL